MNGTMGIYNPIFHGTIYHSDTGMERAAWGPYALFSSGDGGHWENVKYLVVDTWKVDTEPEEDGWSALQHAYEHLEIVKYIVEECGLDPKSDKDYFGRTAFLHGASENGCSEVVVYLILIERVSCG